MSKRNLGGRPAPLIDQNEFEMNVSKWHTAMTKVLRSCNSLTNQVPICLYFIIGIYIDKVNTLILNV